MYGLLYADIFTVNGGSALSILIYSQKTGSNKEGQNKIEMNQIQNN